MTSSSRPIVSSATFDVPVDVVWRAITDQNQMRQLQQRLTALGHDVGGIDGILGAHTRAAVQAEQQRLGMPADAWPTTELLRRL